jgi:hypothetical protein
MACVVRVVTVGGGTVGVAAVDVVAAGEAAVVGVGVCADARPAARRRVMARDRFFTDVLNLGKLMEF